MDGSYSFHGYIQNCVDALNEEIEEVAKKGEEPRYSLRNGSKQRSFDSHFIYRFDTDSDVAIQPDTSIALIVRDRNIDAVLLAVGENFVLISSKVDLGESVPEATLKGSPLFLLRLLKERLEEWISNPGILNSDMVLLSTGKKKPRQLREEIVDASCFDGMNSSQVNTIIKAAGAELLYVWGPPGTGKTTVLARIVEALRNKGERVLVCSNTNIATDNAMLRIYERLKERPEVRKGRVVRLGEPQSEELAENRDILMQAIIAKKEGDLVKRKLGLQDRVSAISNEIVGITTKIKVIEEFHNLTSEIQETSLRLAENEGEIQKLEQSIPKVLNEGSQLIGHIQTHYRCKEDSTANVESLDDLLSILSRINDHLNSRTEELIVRRELIKNSLKVEEIIATLVHDLSEKEALVSVLDRDLKYKKGELDQLSLAFYGLEAEMQDSESHGSVSRFLRGRRNPSAIKNEMDIVQSGRIRSQHDIDKLEKQRANEEQMLEKQKANLVDERKEDARLAEARIEQGIEVLLHEAENDIAKAIEEIKPRQNSVMAFQRDCQSISKQIGKSQKDRESLEKSLERKKMSLSQLLPAVSAKDISEEQLASLREKAESLQEKRSRISNAIGAIEKKIQEIEMEIVKKALVIGTTVARAYSAPLMKEERFDAVLIDEASMVTQPSLAYTVGLAKTQIIIIGDFRQLPPVVTTRKEYSEFLKRDIFHEAGVNNISSDDIDILSQLKVQYRMAPPISALVNQYFYDNVLENHSSVSESKDSEDMRFSQSNLMYINTGPLKPVCSINLKNRSRFNIVHAFCDIELAKELLGGGYHEVGIITPYRAQSDIINKILSTEEGIERERVEVSTVHRFQGKEKDAIIFDNPDSTGVGAGYFSHIADFHDEVGRLYNVAFSRAKQLLIFVSNFDDLKEKITRREKGKYGTGILEFIDYFGNWGKEIPVSWQQSFQSTLQDQALFETHSIENNNSDVFLLEKNIHFADQRSFKGEFLKDLESAEGSVLIFSPYIGRRTDDWISIFSSLIARKVAVKVIISTPKERGVPFRTGTPEDEAKPYIDKLERNGVVVSYRNDMHEKIAVIDREIVWIGSLNILSYTGKTTEAMVRWTGNEIADFVIRNYITYFPGSNVFDSYCEPDLCPKCEGIMILGNRTGNKRYSWHNRPMFVCQSCDSKYYVDGYRVRFHATKKTIGAVEKCPQCGSEVAAKAKRRGTNMRLYECSNTECDYKIDVVEADK